MELPLYDTIVTKILNSHKFYIKDKVLLENADLLLSRHSNIIHASEIEIGYIGKDTFEKTFFWGKKPVHKIPETRDIMKKMKEYLKNFEEMKRAHFSAYNDYVEIYREFEFKNVGNEKYIERVRIVTPYTRRKYLSIYKSRSL